MSLQPGARLGHHHVVAPLGAGGMGEVSLATDTKLGRDVALKVLPAEVARDPDRLARFQREATALAALDHPNIVTVSARCAWAGWSWRRRGTPRTRPPEARTR